MGLYEEALVDARKLKEIAEEDAKRALVESLAPTIRKIISNELAGKTTPLFEEEDPTLGTTPEPPKEGGDAALPPPPPVPTSPEEAPTSSSEPPIQVTGGDTLNMPMPGPDGKLVVDFDDLFVPAEPGQEEPTTVEPPGGVPSPEPVDVNPAPEPVPGTEPPGSAAGTGDLTSPSVEEPQMETLEMFQEELDKTAKRVHRAYTGGAPSVVKEALQEKLFSLVEALESLNLKTKVSPTLNHVFERRLEILHLKLKEAVSGNTYYQTKGDPDMASKSLKNYAAQILAESDVVVGGEVTSPADSHKTEKPMKVDNPTEQSAEKAGNHAQKVSEPTVTLKTEAAELAKLEEELKALIAESEGDSLAADPGKQDLAGAASSIPDKKVGEVDTTKSTAAGPGEPAAEVQGVSENIEHSKDTGSEEEVGKSSTGHPVKETVAVNKKALAEETKRIKAENIKRQIKSLQEQLKECGLPGMEDEAMMGGVPGAMAGHAPSMKEDGTVVNFNFDLADLVPELGELGDNDEIDIVDDEEPAGGVMDLGGSEPPVGGDEGGLPSEEEPKPEEEEEPPGSLAEAIKRGKGPATAKVVKENKALRAELAEQQLYNAKVVHLQPFLNNKNLTKEQKQKIVEFLDRGKTIDQVKAIYGRVKTVLEAGNKARAKVGSSSKTTTAGAAKPGLTEGKETPKQENFFEGRVMVEREKNRLMELAGIKRK